MGDFMLVDQTVKIIQAIDACFSKSRFICPCTGVVAESDYRYTDAHDDDCEVRQVLEARNAIVGKET